MFDPKDMSCQMPLILQSLHQDHFRGQDPQHPSIVAAAVVAAAVVVAAADGAAAAVVGAVRKKIIKISMT